MEEVYLAASKEEGRLETKFYTCGSRSMKLPALNLIFVLCIAYKLEKHNTLYKKGP